MIPVAGSDSQELVLQFAWQVSAALAVLVVLLVIQILVSGLRLDLRHRRIGRLRETWEPILADAAGDPGIALPALARRDLIPFLHLWSYVQQLLLDEACLNLNVVARRAGAADGARRALHSPRLRDRLIAITALGHLRDEEAWPELETIAASPDPVRSLTAVRSLFRIDPGRAAERLIPEIPRRLDWSLAGLAGILAEAGPDAVSEPLAEAARSAPAAHLPRLIRLLELAHGAVAIRAVRRIIATSTDTEVITACLRVFEDPEDLGTVRTLLADERWQVRLHAAVALGRMGTEEDEPRLIRALEDPEWWVRYRAAQALAGLPFMAGDRLRQLARELPGRFARDILRQVMAERELAC
jgi:hypothetical protein